MNKEQNKENRKLPGFYIAVCCCVLAIGAAGYFTQKKETQDSGITVSKAEITPTPIPTKAPALPTIAPVADTVPSSVPQAEESKPVIAEAPKADYTEDNPDMEASVTVNAEETLSFVQPAVGEILAQYSDKPMYNDVLGDWRTHDGVDIAVNEGGSVCAAADGTIDKITYDAMGCCVTLTHSDGYVTKYRQLESAGEFQEGAAVKKGDVIGVIGKNSAETTSAPHLHFEIYKDGECLNPVDVIK